MRWNGRDVKGQGAYPYLSLEQLPDAGPEELFSAVGKIAEDVGSGTGLPYHADGLAGIDVGQGVIVAFDSILVSGDGFGMLREFGFVIGPTIGEGIAEGTAGVFGGPGDLLGDIVGAGEGGIGLGGGENALAGGVGDGGFLGGQERGADPDAVGAGSEDGGKTPRGTDAPGGENGASPPYRIENDLEKRKSGNLAGVATGFGALSDDEINAGVEGTAGVLAGVDLSGNENAFAMKAIDIGGRIAEGDGDDVRLGSDGDVEKLGAALDRPDHQADAEAGIVGATGNGGFLFDGRDQGGGAHADKTEAAGEGNSAGKATVGNAGHRGGDDGVFQVPLGGERGVKHGGIVEGGEAYGGGGKHEGHRDKAEAVR